MAPLVRTGGSRHTGLAALPHRNNQEEKRQKNNKDFYTGIIIPIGTYILGRLVEKDNSFGLVQNIIILLFVVLYIRFIINEFSREWKLLFQSDETKMKYLLDELQDLYDRDYL